MASENRLPPQSSDRHRVPSKGCLYLLLLLLLAATRTGAAGQSLPGCPSKCGEVQVPYPFGLSRNCSRDDTFLLSCNSTSGGTSPPKLYTPGGYRVFNISILQGYLDASLFFVHDCYDRQGDGFIRSFTNTNFRVHVAPPLSISPTRNRFIVTGCDAYFWYWANWRRDGIWTGCLAGCQSLDNVVNSTCNGFGCCESGMTPGLKTLEVVLQSYYNHSRVFDFNPCSYAFIVDRDKFVFNTSWITADYSGRALPEMSAVLDWSIEGTGCSTANTSGNNSSTTSSQYACVSANSECLSSPNGLGYLCNCSAGYTGNPYLRGGCQDIDECKLDRQLYPCYGKCLNTEGSYDCSCPAGTYSDDPKKFQCMSKSRGLSLASKLVIGIGSMILIASSFYFICQQRKFRRLKKKLFQKNGLEQSIIHQQQTIFRIFTMDEIKRATKFFSEDFILGHGGHGTVYKGILDDHRVIAVKKSITIDERRSQQFAKELLILSQVNHKNIVKLLGCCLEYEVPLLIYEYISNGTLFDYIQKKKHNHKIPFLARLKIAIDSADALRYLHKDASPPIIHGDVKSSNIILDEDFNPKVSDFGTSRLVPKDRSQLTTIVQGTRGYLDPEYMKTGKITKKSDVYSYGVILVELLTGKKPFYCEEPEEQNLAGTFISKMKEKRLVDILDHDIVEDGNLEQVLGVADLAIQCLHLIGEERPSMTEVVTILERLMN